MANPWDIPPFPSWGDADPERLFVEVGRFISIWETLEFELSLMHAGIVGENEGEPESFGDGIANYGSKSVFTHRISNLTSKADEFFFKRNNQNVEGEAYGLINEATEMSARRNEISHGILWDISKLSLFSEHLKDNTKPQYAIIAPLYATKHHRVGGFPAFAYNSEMIYTFSGSVDSLCNRVRAFRAAHVPMLR